jgi:hypothetical protein
MNHLQPAARTPPPSPVPPPVPHNHDGPPVDLHDGGNVCQKLWTVRSCVSLDIRTVRHRITEDISDTVVSRFDTSLSDEIDEYTLCLNLEPNGNPQIRHRHWLNITFDFQRGTVTDNTSGINVLFFHFIFKTSKLSQLLLVLEMLTVTVLSRPLTEPLFTPRCNVSFVFTLIREVNLSLPFSQLLHHPKLVDIF